MGLLLPIPAICGHHPTDAHARLTHGTPFGGLALDFPLPCGSCAGSSGHRASPPSGDSPKRHVGIYLRLDHAQKRIKGYNPPCTYISILSLALYSPLLCSFHLISASLRPAYHDVNEHRRFFPLSGTHIRLLKIFLLLLRLRLHIGSHYRFPVGVVLNPFKEI